MNNKKIIQPVLWGILMVLVIVVSIYFSKPYNNQQEEETKSYEYENFDDSKNNPEMEGVQ